jgi:chromosome segregation ATPase
MRALTPLLVLAGVLCGGCTVGDGRGRPAAAPDGSAQGGAAPGASGEQLTIQQHLDELEGKINQLERQLGSGRGALKEGSTFSVDGGGQESVLERLRRLQNEIAAAKAEIAAKNKLIADLHQDLTGASKRSEGLAERADSLGHVQDSLVTAQQELADRQTRLAALTDQLALSELARLRAEKSYYQLASGLIKLAPGQTQELVDLQELVRLHIKELRPADAGAKR